MVIKYVFCTYFCACGLIHSPLYRKIYKMPRAHLCAFPSIKAKQRALNFKFLKFREKQSGRLSQRIKLLYNI